MAHPGDALFGQPLEDGTGYIVISFGFAVFTGGIILGRRYLTTQIVSKELAAVANAEHRNAQLKDSGINLRRVDFVDTAGASGENDANGRIRFDSLYRHGIGMHLAVDIALTDPPGDQLVILSAEIQDQHFFHRGLLTVQCHRMQRRLPQARGVLLQGTHPPVPGSGQCNPPVGAEP